MSLAAKASKESPMRFQMGAVIIKKGKILSVGNNSYKTHPKYGSGKYCYLHAEGAAIYNAIINRKDLCGAEIYVYRRYGRISKPCKYCLELIKSVGIKKIIYTNERRNFSEVKRDKSAVCNYQGN